MAYEAYLDKEKKFILKAKDAAINHISQTFYCKTLGCKACMTLVDASHPESAYLHTARFWPDTRSGYRFQPYPVPEAVSLLRDQS